MKYGSMFINSENLKEIALKFNEKIKELNDCYNSANQEARELDGSNDNWKGDKQKEFYLTYEQLSSKFPTNIEKFNEFYTFLCKVIKDYEEKDSSINKDVDINVDNLDM